MEHEGIYGHIKALQQEERIGIELLVSMMIVDDLEKQTLEDKEYLIRFYKKAKESIPHKELFGYVLETIFSKVININILKRDIKNKKKSFHVFKAFFSNLENSFAIRKVGAVYQLSNPCAFLAFSQVYPCLRVMHYKSISYVVLQTRH